MEDSLLQRLAASRDRIADYRKALKAEMARRDSLICEAIGRREKYKTVAQHAGRSIGTVAAIVGAGDPLAEERREEEVAAGVFITAA
jgi:hypothetical protein